MLRRRRAPWEQWLSDVKSRFNVRNAGWWSAGPSGHMLRPHHVCGVAPCERAAGSSPVPQGDDA